MGGCNKLHRVLTLYTALQNGEVSGGQGTAGFGHSCLLLCGSAIPPCGEEQQAQDGGGGFWTLSSGNQRISPAAVALSGGEDSFLLPWAPQTLSVHSLFIMHWARIRDSAEVIKKKIPPLQTHMDTQECDTTGQRRL